MNTNILKKVVKYTGIAGTILATTTTSKADIVYTDIDPDTSLLIVNANSFSLDIDGDSLMDINITVATSSSVSTSYTYRRTELRVSGANSNVQVANSTSAYLFAFSPQNLINASAHPGGFVDDARALLFSSFSSYQYSYNGPNGFGFNDDKFLGVKIRINSIERFGWVRLETKFNFNSDTVVIKSYAFEDSLYFIHAGNAGLLDVVDNLIFEDVSNTGDASDLAISFDKLNDEEGLIAYHALVVKKSNTTLFSADTILSLNALEIPVTGSNISLNLPATQLDSDGDAITNGNDYNVIIVAEGENNVVYWTSSVSNRSNVASLSSTTSLNEEFENTAKITALNRMLTITSLVNESLNVSILSIDGKSVLNKNINSKEENINLSSFTSGIYIVAVKSNKGVTTKKIIL